jgi:hypothetical protein
VKCCRRNRWIVDACCLALIQERRKEGLDEGSECYIGSSVAKGACNRQERGLSENLAWETRHGRGGPACTLRALDTIKRDSTVMCLDLLLAELDPAIRNSAGALCPRRRGVVRRQGRGI